MVNTKIVNAIGTAFVKSIINSAQSFSNVSRQQRSSRKYLGVQSHPDDEVPIAGTFQRIIRYSNSPYFLTFTNGDRNTVGDRMAEFRKSLGVLGYRGQTQYLMSENNLLDLICTEQGQSTDVSPSRIREAARVIREKISQIERITEEKQSDTILVPEYSGSHFVHDITNMAAVVAARRVVKNRPVEVYSFPQTYLQLKPRVMADNLRVQQLIEELVKPEQTRDNGLLRDLTYELTGATSNKFDLGEFATYAIGKFLDSNARGLTDKGIGMIDGELKLGFREMINKLKSQGAHTSQGSVHNSQSGSFGRMSANGTDFADFSREGLREVPLDKDFTQKPETRILLYEVVPWRPHASWTTFWNLYQEVVSKE